MRSVQLFGTSKDLQHKEDDNEEEEDLEEDVDNNVEEVYEKEFDGPGKFPFLFLEYKLLDGVMLVLVLMLVALPSLVVLLLFPNSDINYLERYFQCRIIGGKVPVEFQVN
ncbi:hypothetical protein BY996DRAFT_6612421 [Phakopsora pachyrhizi]|uniref:Uncharacterized protein n=1 Tax=Phakopsora pachyrhizi TaxID=170000 RepID=A0AAV0APG9_PHAPC|nr:hypothetical protein BY996DRAFT_6612421 [Phakopsora pachyrhizi]CAH7669716.1 hypothetical protein PPACK8108_LOCUS4357 [Phakopsora pachyrhizi]